MESPVVKIWVRTEDGCEMQFSSDQKVRTAYRWSPRRMREQLASELGLGDYIQSYLGWSSITDITR